MKKNFKIIFLAIFVLMSLNILAQTEQSGSYQSTNNASAYHYSGSIVGAEKLKIYTYIWGQVRKPGLYIVPDDTDLLSLVSLAGGPTNNAKLNKIKVIRPTKEGEKVIEINMKEYLETGNEELIPVLKPGDTILVTGTVFFALSRVADFLADIAIILSVYTAITKIND